MAGKPRVWKRVQEAAKSALNKLKAPFGFDLTAKFKADAVEIEFPIDMEGETVWANQQQIADLFGVDRSVISRHIKNLFESNELDPRETRANFARVRTEGGKTVSREIEHYTLDVILAVGYRVSSAKATAFRRWASSVLKGYIKDGYALDGKRLNTDPSALLRLAQEVRAIRTSEKNLYAQVCEVFSVCAIDYDSNSDVARKFFATCQDVCHFAASGKTAAEIIVERADARKPNMGLTALGNISPRAADVTIAKNYLSAQELRKMQLISESFLLYAESMAEQEKQVSMARLLDRFTSLVGFFEFPVFQGYSRDRPTRKVADSHAKAQYELFKRLERPVGSTG